MIESEKVLERKLCKRVKELGGNAYKFVSPNQRGVPDRPNSGHSFKNNKK